MKIKFVVLITLLAAFSIYAQNDFDSTTKIKVGDPMPEFILKALEGKDLSSSELKGRVVLLNFWATWCGPCRKEMPLMQKEIFETIKNKNFVMAAVSRGEETDVVKKFIDQNKYTFPIYLDKETKTYSLFANKYIPRNFVIGKDGKVKWATAGFVDEEFKKMIQLIKDELAR
jgi:peroxiredoxin